MTCGTQDALCPVKRTRYGTKRALVTSSTCHKALVFVGMVTCMRRKLQGFASVTMRMCRKALVSASVARGLRCRLAIRCGDGKRRDSRRSNVSIFWWDIVCNELSVICHVRPISRNARQGLRVTGRLPLGDRLSWICEGCGLPICVCYIGRTSSSGRRR